MKVIKPGKLSVLTRCFEHERRFYLGVSVLAFVPFAGPTTLLSEVGMWTFVAQVLGKDAALDAGIPKSRAEYIVVGSAHCPGGQPRDRLPVRARVGSSEKIIHVYGDRFWQGNRATEPRPFTSMPLDWAHAYGGPEFAANPLGKGAAPTMIEGVEIVPLANLEHPDAARSRVPPPVSFMPVDISWPQRTKLAGTHDQHWLENLFPGFARDIDWSIFNIAAPDQQVNARAWVPGERFELEHMHPSKPVVHGHIPHLQARALITRKRVPTAEEVAAEPDAARWHPPADVHLAPQTLWLFPDVEQAIVIFQGSTEITTDDGADIVHLIVAAENEGRPKSLEHYTAVLAGRLDKERAAINALRDGDLLPEQLEKVVEAHDAEQLQLNATEGLLQQNMYRKNLAEVEKARALVASHGLDPDQHGPLIPEPPAPPPTPDELPAAVEKLMAQAKQQEEDAKAMVEREQARVDALVDAQKLPGFTSETVHEEMKQTPIGPPTFTVASMLAMLGKIASDCRAQGIDAYEIEAMLVDEQLHAQWKVGEEQAREGYRITAHLQNPAPAMPEPLRPLARERVREAIEAKQDFSSIDMTGADLSGMDLRDADLSGGFFESVRFDGADLRGAKLVGAVLAHASLQDARLDGADLRKANLGKAQLHRTNLSDAQLGEAKLVDADLNAAILHRARLDGADLSGASFVDTDASGIVCAQLMLIETKLAGIKLVGAKLGQATLIRLDLAGADLSHAKFEDCTFLTCKLARANLYEADLRGCRFVEGCELDEAVFTGAQLQRCNLRETKMRGCDLRRANLDDADLTGCDLRGAKFYQAVARQTRFDKANLTEVEFISANLMNASLTNATIDGADFRGANLYAADLARIRNDGRRAQFDEALLTKVRVYPRYGQTSPEGQRKT
jgi:uncharacterized protein YjbI with pentapeptide repeats